MYFFQFSSFLKLLKRKQPDANTPSEKENPETHESNMDIDAESHENGESAPNQSEELTVRRDEETAVNGNKEPLTNTNKGSTPNESTESTANQSQESTANENEEMTLDDEIKIVLEAAKALPDLPPDDPPSLEIPTSIPDLESVPRTNPVLDKEIQTADSSESAKLVGTNFTGFQIKKKQMAMFWDGQMVESENIPDIVFTKESCYCL